MRLLAGLAIAFGLHGTVINSVRCTAATSCTTPWSVQAGNALVVARWYRAAGGGALSDRQGNVYTPLHAASSYGSNTRLDGTLLAAGGAPVTVTSSAAEQAIVLVEISGVTLDPDGLEKGNGPTA
jgi:hypothetical protein